MSKGYDSLVSHLESRYDYHSARVIAKEAVAAAGLEDAKDLGAKEMDKFLGALGSLGYDAEAVGKSINGGDAAEAPAKPAADDAAEEKPAAKKAAAKKAAKPKAKAKKKK